MAKIRIIYLTIILLSCFVVTHAQKKRALLVGISEYGANTGWKSIHGANDVDILTKVLKGFTIRELKNSNATYDNIIKELNYLRKQSKEGDLVYIHFSGHGQPYEDSNGDEPDGWDESFVPYDAHLYYDNNVYSGNKHLTDDKLNTYFVNIRKKLGESGFLYVTIDACHAGNSYRESNEDIYRGTGKGFSKNNKLYRVPKVQKQYYKIDNNSGLAPVVMLEACQAHQRNTEINVNGMYYGPLTYAIYLTLQTKSIDKQAIWIEGLPLTMKELMPSWNKQKMVVESSVNYK